MIMNRKNIHKEANVSNKKKPIINTTFANITTVCDIMEDKFIGMGHYFNEVTSNDYYYLYTHGLIGCVGLFISFIYDNKKLVWLTHVIDGIDEDSFKILFEKIWVKIGILISNTDIKYNDINTDTRLTNFELYLVANRNILRDRYNKHTIFNNNTHLVGYIANDSVNYKGIVTKLTVQILEEYLSSIEIKYKRLCGNTIVYMYKKVKLFNGTRKTISTVYSGLKDFDYINSVLTDIDMFK